MKTWKLLPKIFNYFVFLRNCVFLAILAPFLSLADQENPENNAKKKDEIVLDENGVVIDSDNVKTPMPLPGSDLYVFYSKETGRGDWYKISRQLHKDGSVCFDISSEEIAFGEKIEPKKRVVKLSEVTGRSYKIDSQTKQEKNRKFEFSRKFLAITQRLVQEGHVQEAADLLDEAIALNMLDEEFLDQAKKILAEARAGKLAKEAGKEGKNLVQN